MKLRRAYKILIAGAIIIPGVFVLHMTADAATFTWEQSSWSGGLDGGTYPVHPTNETGWTKYSALDASTIINASGSVTASFLTGSSTQTTDTDFNAGTFSSTTVFGSGLAGSVILNTPTQSATNTWATLTNVPEQTFGQGMTGANGYIYILPGNSTQNNGTFYRYTPSSNSWSTMAGVPTAPGNGAALVYPGNGNFIYYDPGNTTSTFLRYSISGNSWSTMASAPATLYTGTTLVATGGNFIYALDDVNAFYRYSISANSWATEAGFTGTAEYDSMAYPGTGNYIYAIDGAADTTLYRYNISGNGWATGLAAAPTAFSQGSSLVTSGTGGDYIYALAGNTGTGKVLMRYSISGNSWTTVASIPTAPTVGAQFAYPTTGNFFYDAPGNGGQTFYRYNFTTTYAATGTFVSSAIDLGQNSIPTTFGFDQTATSGESIQFQLRGAPTSGGLSSATWYGPTGTSDFYTATSGTSINPILNDSRYFQYEMYASTTNNILTPSFLDETINYQYYPATTTLTSSVYNSSSPANIVAKIQWAASTTASTSVSFQFASAPDSAGSPGAFSAFVGPDGTSNTYFTSSTGGDSFPAVLATSSQWFKYKAYLVSNDSGSSPAALSDVKVNYVVNAPPQLASTTYSVSESATGTVSIAYGVLDPDTNTGTITPGFVTPSFQYSLNGGATWTNILASTTSSGDTSNKAVSTSTYSNYTATWYPAEQIPNSYSTTAEVKVTVNDNEAANNTASASSTNFILDTTAPTPGGIPILIDESQSSALITLSATDNSALFMKVGKRSDLSDATYVPYNSTTTLSFGIGDNVYAQFKDAYGNATAILNTIPPETPSNIFYEDTSDPVTSEWRIFFAWGVIDNPNAGFKQYNIYRAINGGAYSLLATSSNRNLNYIVDTNLDTTKSYSYKLTAQDLNNDVSFYSSSITHSPNGTGGSDLSVPVLSNVTVTNITSTGATITWTSNKYSDSSVFYSATSTYPGSIQSSYGSSTGVPAVVESHTVTLSDLTPGTQYYFMSQSTDPDNNIGTSANSSYTFTTTAGPVISNTTASTIFDTSATITWNTDSPSNSTVYYSTSPTMSSPSNTSSGTLTANHSVTITGLVHGMKYYYYVTSEDSFGDTAIDNNVINGSVQYYSFTTTYDTVPPVISAVSAASVGVTSATIAWTTDKSATSRVTYATNAGLTGATTTSETSTYSTGHAVILNNLVQGTTYYYNVYSTDVNGIATTSPNDGTTYSFTTVTAGSYITLPNLSAISVASVTPSTAQITWTTDVNSDSSVFYTASSTYPGPGRGSYQSSVGVPALVQSHTVDLAGLTPSTQYFFFVQSTDASDNVGTSTDPSYTFTTTAGPVISSTTAGTIQDTSAIITWKTTLPADSVLYYSTSADFSNPSTITGSKTLTTNHSITVTGLTQGTPYYYYVTSTDSSGNTATDNNILGGVVTYYNFTTVSDNSPLIISNVAPGLVGISGATITWTTDRGATSQVTYDTDPAFGTATSTTLTSVYTIDHAVILSGLATSTTYYYSVYSDDQNGNSASSSSSGAVQYSFTTADSGTTTIQNVTGGGGGGGTPPDTTPPTISAISVTQIGSGSVNITFTSSEIANGVVNYGPDATYGSQAGDATVYQLSHSIVLSGLTPLSTYHFSIASADIFNNSASSKDATFTLVNFADPDANPNLYTAATPAATSTSIGTVLTADQQTLLDQVKNVSIQMAEDIITALTQNPNLASVPESQLASAIQNLTSKIVSAPVISGSTIVVNPGSHSAEITWTTDKPSNSLISYAADDAYDPGTANPYTITAGNPNDTLTDHDITLPNLDPTTTYHFEVSSKGALGPTATSQDHTFKTSSALPQVFNTTFTDIGENSATLDWNTDVPTKTKITLKNTQTGVSTSTTESTYNTSHTYSFDNLAFSTAYDISLTATDASSTASDPLVVPFSTVLSTKAAIISNVRVTTSLIPGNVETAQTIVSWKTDKPSTSRIFFGQGSDAKLDQSTAVDPGLVTDHVVITTLLAPGTVYKIMAESGDSSGNVTDSSPYTVLTPAPAGSIVDLIISNLQGTFGVFTK